MNIPRYSIMLPTWLFGEAELLSLKQRILDATAGPEFPLTPTEKTCIGSIEVELAFRKSEYYKAVKASALSLLEEENSNAKTPL